VIKKGKVPLVWAIFSIQDREDTMNNVVEANIQKPASPLSVRNFRLLWIGEGISLLGDQFYMIALPWMVLQLTGSALALGTVLLPAIHQMGLETPVAEAA
jgi:hypothetical protein